MKKAHRVILGLLLTLSFLLGVNELEARAEASPMDIQKLDRLIGIELDATVNRTSNNQPQQNYPDIPFVVPHPFDPGAVAECRIKLLPNGNAKIVCNFGLEFTYKIICDQNGCRVVDFFGNRVCKITRSSDKTIFDCKIPLLITDIKFTATIRIENCHIIIDPGDGSPPISLPIWLYGPILLEPWRDGALPWLPALPDLACFQAPEAIG